MKLEWFISNRYLKAKKDGGTSLIAKVAIFGLILAVMTLITVLSVMNGFHEQLRNQVLGAISHGYVASYDDFYNYEKTQKKLIKQKDVLATSPYIEEFGLLNYGQNSSGVNIRGIDFEQEKTTSTILNNLKNIQSFGDKNIIIGKDLADSMGLDLGDKITLITTKISSDVFNSSPRLKRFVISHIFSSGSEYDSSLVFIQLNQAQRLFDMRDRVSGIHLKVADVLNADKILQQLKFDKEKFYSVSWQEQKRNFITALNLEKQMIAIILSLIVAVAVFNIISMMIMVIKDKKNDIAILRTFGFSAKQILITFFLLGLKIGVLGILIGTLLGVGLSSNIDSVISFIEMIFNTKFFPEEVFYISNFPSKIMLNDVLLVMGISFILVILSSIYPAKTASKINISQTLKEL